MHRWKPGESGNPAGRIKGAKVRTTKLREQLESRSQELVEAAISLALSGDTAALKICMERILPALRPRDLPQPLAIVPGDPLTAQGQQILQTMARGEVSISDGSLLLSALANQSRLEESTELRERVAAMEQQLNISPPS